ncbi:flagellar basal body-associated protein FliL [Yersinia frederiksenii]|uniref:flagellar basal body-associated protein FliL n=1 Tax=Yersinia frederiksenii TaxID=29484 RepID=UPI0005DDA6CD|nr:flagellar basal body-associated protein FliL [Yersinia frederiksenii]CFQ87030.1 flagellar basal body-associated protein FliL [Yersinia frederiksenii]CNC20854.1 flagellar basal body-associated protein FliL [Yersinia frederiksenii]CNF11927.1 flagellar basal body-associated protein FliL [Yersinia frederiksenii]
MSENTFPAKRKSSIWVILLVLIAVAATAGGGYSWWMLNKSKPATAKAAPVSPVFMPLETFTVNLITPDNNLDRVLYIGLTLRLPDDTTRAKLNDYLPEVRSRLLLLLSRQSADSLSNEEGKQRLVGEIKNVLSPPMVKGQPNQVVSDVLFTAFILR